MVMEKLKKMKKRDKKRDKKYNKKYGGKYEKIIIEKLAEVKDPEFGIDIVNLGLIYDIKVDKKEKKAYIKMTMTTPTCPFATQILREVQQKLTEIKEIDEIHVELVWTPPWSKDMMSEEAKLMLGI